ncbi:MAG: hypothetical protein DDT27_01515 [Dehalococcoidia bacterium]|nr:hypothetical protein [Chloroflexota bacterium]
MLSGRINQFQHTAHFLWTAKSPISFYDGCIITCFQAVYDYQGSGALLFFRIYIVVKLTGKLKVVLFEHLPVADNNMQAILSNLNSQPPFCLKIIRRHDDDLLLLCLVQYGACQWMF